VFHVDDDENETRAKCVFSCLQSSSSSPSHRIVNKIKYTSFHTRNELRERERETRSLRILIKICIFSVLFFSYIVAWFTFDPQLSSSLCTGLTFMNDNRTVSADGWEHCVALGSVGFSRGVHYWEFTIDKYTSDTDPAFGIARIDVSRDKMLGKYRKKS
jgi:hypothetical protein